MTRRGKPRAIVTGKSYRVVRSGGCYTLEAKDGRDALGVARWRDHGPASPGFSYCTILRDLGDALELARKRRRRAR